METLGADTRRHHSQIISPSWYHFRYAPGRAYAKDVYSSDEEYFADAAKAYQVELKLLYEAGLRNVQIDDPNLACKAKVAHCTNGRFVLMMRFSRSFSTDFCSDAMLKGWAEDKGNTETADEMFDKYIKYYNACFQRPADMHLGIHLCKQLSPEFKLCKQLMARFDSVGRGNYIGGRHFSEGAYDMIAQKLFKDCKSFCRAILIDSDMY